MLTSAADTKHKVLAKGLIVKSLKMLIKMFTFKNPRNNFPRRNKGKIKSKHMQSD